MEIMSGMEFMNCENARPLVPAYLDGELGEARASLLRKHLLECQPCRASAQDGKALKRWFAPLAQASRDTLPEFNSGVPQGFAARIARRAFAGDTGERGRVQPTLVRGGASDLTPFLLRATAIAAGVLFVLAVGMRMRTRPELNRLSADDNTPAPIERVIEELDQLNQREAGLAPDAAAEGRVKLRSNGEALSNGEIIKR